MNIAVFNTKPYDEEFLRAANRAFKHKLTFLEPRLSEQTVSLAAGFPAVCVFVHDEVSARVLEILNANGTHLVALRCAGFNNVDLKTAERLNMKVVRVPAYSPYAVAEHTVGLMLTLNRKIYKSYTRVREGNFSLDGLLGFDMHQRTVGVIGTGKIGAIVARIVKGFGCHVLAYDVRRNPEVEQLGAQYVSLNELYKRSDIITLHCPLIPETYHLIGADAVRRMKPGVMLINSSRGELIDTKAVIAGLKSGKIGYLGLDVYEEEADLFFEDLSTRVIQDDVFSRLLTFPNVIITGHQAFFTREAMKNIAETTLKNIADVENGRPCPNNVTAVAGRK
jgi:D-lactate dehydrogenase